MHAEWQSLGIFGDLIFIFVVVIELWHFYLVAGSWCPSDRCAQGIPVAFVGMGMGGDTPRQCPFLLVGLLIALQQ